MAVNDAPQVLLRARNAGLRQHRRRALEGVTGDWPPIFDRGTHDWLTHTLTDPARTTNKGKERRHLLSGLLVCGICGSGAVGVLSGRIRHGERQPASYGSKSCHRLRRKQSAVDAMVVDDMIQLPGTPRGTGSTGHR